MINNDTLRFLFKPPESGLSETDLCELLTSVSRSDADLFATWIDMLSAYLDLVAADGARALVRVIKSDADFTHYNLHTILKDTPDEEEWTTLLSALSETPHSSKNPKQKLPESISPAAVVDYLRSAPSVHKVTWAPDRRFIVARADNLGKEAVDFYIANNPKERILLVSSLLDDKSFLRIVWQELGDFCGALLKPLKGSSY